MFSQPMHHNRPDETILYVRAIERALTSLSPVEREQYTNAVSEAHQYADEAIYLFLSRRTPAIMTACMRQFAAVIHPWIDEMRKSGELPRSRELLEQYARASNEPGSDGQDPGYVAGDAISAELKNMSPGEIAEYSALLDSVLCTIISSLNPARLQEWLNAPGEDGEIMRQLYRDVVASPKFPRLARILRPYLQAATLEWH